LSESLRRLIHSRRLETSASAGWRNLEIERGVHRVAAFLDQIFRRLARGSDLDENGLIAMFQFAEVGTQSTLAFMNLKHGCSFRQS
jgi:hypothetical protein